ncbi:hypothetical protein ACFL0M_01450 [Thermodesulfobacteriota bacterium]
MKNTSVGQPIPRIDAIDKVTGNTIFGEDLDFSKALYGKALRNPFVRARILNIDFSEARRLPGVKAIVTDQDIHAMGGEALKDYPFWANEKLETFAPVVQPSEELKKKVMEKWTDFFSAT